MRYLLRVRYSVDYRSLPTFVDELQARGRYVFRREELEALGLSRVAIKNAVQRLVVKGRLAVPRRGFYVVVPLEYRSAGAPPASWFIDDLMHWLSQPYYVGLLSAAAIHGAAHHSAQELQVVTFPHQRLIEVGRGRIRFVVNRHLDRTPVARIKTETGTMAVSTPEGTALDLVRYMAPAGHLSNVATVLAELSERIEAAKLVAALSGETEVASVQRLGYLLERVDRPELANALASWLAERGPHAVALNPSLSTEGSPRVLPWHVIENEALELDA